MRIHAQNAYFVQNAYSFPTLGDCNDFTGRVESIENEASERAGQLVQREGILILLQETPHICLFPFPSLPQGFH